MSLGVMFLGQGDIGADVLNNQVLNGIVYDYICTKEVHLSYYED